PTVVLLSRPPPTAAAAAPTLAASIAPTLTAIAATAALAAAALAPRRVGRRIQAHHVRCLGALRLLDDVELDLFTLVEDLEAGPIDCAVVHEHVRPALPLEKAVPLLLREPLDGAIGTSHRRYSWYERLRQSKVRCDVPYPRKLPRRNAPAAGA